MGCVTTGPCTFEDGLCAWSDISQDNNKWLRVKASENTEPPTDHTTGTGDTCADRTMSTIYTQHCSSQDNTDYFITHYLIFSGHYMYVNLSSVLSESEVQFKSPLLPPTSPYCQLV